MNPRQRFFQTVRFGRPDRIPFEPGWPRESTLRAWRTQGLPEGVSWQTAISQVLGLPQEPFFTQIALPISFRLLPGFAEQVLEHRDGHLVVQDEMGAIVEISDQYDFSYLRSARDFVTRRWRRFPVQNRQDWEEKMRWRYDPADPRRWPADVAPLTGSLNERDELLSLNINGPFWQIREWCGFEGLCRMMVEQPDFVQEMAEFWGDFVAEMLKRLPSRLQPDSVMISEDMAYKAHSMISPRMTRRFLLPAWRRWIEKLHAGGETVVMIDSDGYIGELLPLFIEAGFESTWPLEAAAGNDLVAYRRQYGRRIAFGGGIDKRLIAAGGEALRAELERLAPVIREGGYLPGCDHGVPSDVSWPNFVAYSRRLAELTGWL